MGLAVIEDADVPFNHDWVASVGYFTGRAREVPPGCEEIDEAERRRREDDALATRREHFAEPFPGGPTMQPRVDAE